jgi:Mg/Co/Ni transporter MgtE
VSGLLVIECVPALDGVAVQPCGTVGTQALVPVVRQITGGPLDYSGQGQLFAWALTFVLVAFAVGLTTGAIMRVIRSA